MDSESAKKLLFKKVKLNKTKPDEIKKLLEDNNLDINIKNSWGETLIYNCCKHAVNLELLNWLYDQGCDPKIINCKKLNALNACLEWNHKKNYEKVLDWLILKGINVEKYYNDLPYLHNMVICHSNAKSLNWIAKKFDINEKDKNGNTPLHMSVHQDTEHNSPLACYLLIENGADVNIKNNLGWTPVHLACFSGFSNCLQDMLGKGKFDKSIKDNNGKTAYEVLIESQTDGIARRWPGDFKKSIEIMEKYK